MFNDNEYKELDKAINDFKALWTQLQETLDLVEKAIVGLEAKQALCMDLEAVCEHCNEMIKEYGNGILEKALQGEVKENDIL